MLSSYRAIISHCEVARQVSFASAGQFLQALVSLSSGTEELFLTVFSALLSNTKNARVLHCIVDYTIVEKRFLGTKSVLWQIFHENKWDRDFLCVFQKVWLQQRLTNKQELFCNLLSMRQTKKNTFL